MALRAPNSAHITIKWSPSAEHEHKRKAGGFRSPPRTVLAWRPITQSAIRGMRISAKNTFEYRICCRSRHVDLVIIGHRDTIEAHCSEQGYLVPSKLCLNRELLLWGKSTWWCTVSLFLLYLWQKGFTNNGSFSRTPTTHLFVVCGMEILEYKYFWADERKAR